MDWIGECAAVLMYEAIAIPLGGGAGTGRWMGFGQERIIAMQCSAGGPK